MRTPKRIQIYLLIAIGIVFFLANSCKKDEPIDPIITWSNPADIIKGTPLSTAQLNATCNVSGTFVYTPAIGAVLNAGTNQTLQVNFTPSDTKHYNTLTKTVKINVIAKTVPIITWSNPADIVYGTLLSATQLNATANVLGTFVYTPGIGTKLDAGTNQILKVDFTPTDATNYNTVQKTVTINVQPPIFTPSTTVTDIDGNEYLTVKIGTQTWMVENLKTSKYNDNTAILFAANDADWHQKTEGAYSWYNNDASNKATYGALYNWWAVKTGKLAPIGWHVSTNTDWNTLLNYLTERGCGTTGDSKIAKALASTIGWNSDTQEGTVGNTDYPDKRNVSGFTALPGGYRVDNGSFNQGAMGFYWTSNQYDLLNAWLWTIHYNGDYLWSDYYPGTIGCSVRCVKDN